MNDRKRVCILLMDSFGIGSSIDSKKYGDEKSNTFFHIHQDYKKSIIGNQENNLHIPNLTRLGIYHSTIASNKSRIMNVKKLNKPAGYFGYGVEQSEGKDTPSGHWEIAGVTARFKWGVFPNKKPCFPKNLINEILKETDALGFIGNKHASGADIIKQYGLEHIKTKKPIVYTSKDSVIQIAAHEKHFGLNNLYKLCKKIKHIVNKYHIGRVIARPFIGENKQNFQRSKNRRDYSTSPPKPSILNFIKADNKEVIAIGKIGDIFNHSGVTKSIKKTGNAQLFDETIKQMNEAKTNSLIFTNFVDFDSYYGHRRDVHGYARALEEFDKKIPELEHEMSKEDIVIITSDHGCDPTFQGNDHTREHIPILAFGKNLKCKYIGRRNTFSDIGKSVSNYLSIKSQTKGTFFL